MRLDDRGSLEKRRERVARSAEEGAAESNRERRSGNFLPQLHLRVLPKPAAPPCQITSSLSIVYGTRVNWEPLIVWFTCEPA